MLKISIVDGQLCQQKFSRLKLGYYQHQLTRFRISETTSNVLISLNLSADTGVEDRLFADSSSGKSSFSETGLAPMLMKKL